MVAVWVLSLSAWIVGGCRPGMLAAAGDAMHNRHWPTVGRSLHTEVLRKGFCSSAWSCRPLVPRMVLLGELLVHRSGPRRSMASPGPGIERRPHGRRTVGGQGIAETSHAGTEANAGLTFMKRSAQLGESLRDLSDPAPPISFFLLVFPVPENSCSMRLGDEDADIIQ